MNWLFDYQNISQLVFCQKNQSINWLIISALVFGEAGTRETAI